ncbi:hypothetical protein [Aquirufa antheringensis]|uniref:hypothetical protein n=1 Tax=Aquirufa antheringensis TaxID=2516559 RepID=UPI00208F0781|nr:hypothetical protein [Aquirufa antheringensis]USQ03156.1 hypothetical protein G9X63_03210 [Aquirufa antheringensis]
MLLLSGFNLFYKCSEFTAANEDITVFSPYIKTEQIRKLNSSNSIKRIIVRWEIRDLCLGVSDLDLYYYCRENNIALYRNTRIHLKVLWNHKSDLIFGSANITNRGVGESGDFNYELAGANTFNNIETFNYLNKIIFDSEYVDQKLFDEINKLVSNTELPILNYPILDTIKKQVDSFLISQLPMTESPLILFENINDLSGLNEEEFRIISHDMVLFDLKPNMLEAEFYVHLRSQFNNHPFVVKLKDFVKSRPNCSIHYGGCVTWIQENTTTVPTPRSWELKKQYIINNLYEWVCFFDLEFSYEVPSGGHSQILTYNGFK